MHDKSGDLFVEFRRELDRELAQDRRVLRAYIRGVLVAFAIMGLAVVATLAWGQTIPREAHDWRREIIREARAQWGLTAPTAMFAAQVHQESAWRPDAVSRVGAQGLAQFMPSTTRWISGVYSALAEGDPFNPRWAIRALVTYDRHLYERVEAISRCDRLAFALSAYNGGLRWVHLRQAASPRPLVCFDATCDINPGVAPSNQAENREYSRRILLKLEPAYAAAGFGSRSCGNYGGSPHG